MRLLDKAMGSDRAYQKAIRPTIEQNAVGGRVMGNSLISARKYNINNEPAPVNYHDSLPSDLKDYRPSLARRKKLMANELKDARDLIDGRLVSRECPEHGTYKGYNYYWCRCIPCSEAHSKYKAEAYARQTRG